MLQDVPDRKLGSMVRISGLFHLPSSSSFKYIWFTRGPVSLPDILVCLGANGSKYIRNWKIRATYKWGMNCGDITHWSDHHWSQHFLGHPSGALLEVGLATLRLVRVKWGYKTPYKLPYKWLTGGCFTPISGVKYHPTYTSRSLTVRPWK